MPQADPNQSSGCTDTHGDNGHMEWYSSMMFENLKVNSSESKQPESDVSCLSTTNIHHIALLRNKSYQDNAIFASNAHHSPAD